MPCRCLEVWVSLRSLQHHRGSAGRNAQRPPSLLLEEVTQAAADPFAALNALLNEYNIEQVGPAHHVPLWLFARDPSGKVQGGVRGQTYWSWCTIDVLSVAEPYRRQGIGSRLLAAEEAVKSIAQKQRGRRHSRRRPRHARSIRG